ncbi:MAG: apolipoprotein N-acyltransferase [Pseudomonadota bacterium]
MSVLPLPRAGWRNLGILAVAGAVAALGQAPFDFWHVGILGFAVGIGGVSLAARPGRAAWAFGVGYFAIALHWIVEPFLVDAARHGWMAPFGLAAMAGGLALFWAAAGFCAAFAKGATFRAFLFATALALAEVARAYILSGFPWAHPGHILIDTPALGLAPFAGPHGLTMTVLALGATLATLMARPIWAASVFGVVFLVLQLSPQPAPDAASDTAARVRLVQPNAAQHLKWREDMIPVFFERGLELSRGADVDLIVWPETTLPVLLERSTPWRAAIAEAAGGVPVAVGAQRLDNGQARNSMALLDGEGEIGPIYDKHRLVPFGEYIPLRSVADLLRLDGLAAIAGGGYWPGAGPAVADFGPRLGRAFLMICYEAIFPQYIRQVERPDWQLHLTNDAWFGTFSGPFQHLALARLRAAESGLPVLRAANTGVSAAIDGRGQVVASLALGTAGALDVALPPALPRTLYARTGDLPVFVLLVAVLVTLLTVARKMRH